MCIFCWRNVIRNYGMICVVEIFILYSRREKHVYPVHVIHINDIELDTPIYSCFSNENAKKAEK